MPWLVKGADVNIIELAWAWMKRRLAKAKFDTFEENESRVGCYSTGVHQTLD